MRPEYPHQGYLDFAGISLNPTTGSLQLRAIIPNPETVILPGMFARVRAPIDEEKGGPAGAGSGHRAMIRWAPLSAW